MPAALQCRDLKMTLFYIHVFTLRLQSARNFPQDGIANASPEIFVNVCLGMIDTNLDGED